MRVGVGSKSFSGLQKGPGVEEGPTAGLRFSDAKGLLCISKRQLFQLLPEVGSRAGQGHFLVAKHALHLGISRRGPVRASQVIEATPNQPKKKERKKSFSPLGASACFLPGLSPDFTLSGHSRLFSVIFEPRPCSYRVNRSQRATVAAGSFFGGSREGDRMCPPWCFAQAIEPHCSNSPERQAPFFSSFVGYNMES